MDDKAIVAIGWSESSTVENYWKITRLLGKITTNWNKIMNIYEPRSVILLNQKWSSCI